MYELLEPGRIVGLAGVFIFLPAPRIFRCGYRNLLNKLNAYPLFGSGFMNL
jgi:hypothetical protein